MTAPRARRALRGAAWTAGLLLASVAGAAPGRSASASAPGPGVGRPTLRHVLLISVDGLHALDLQHFVRAHPDSAMAKLSARGLTYTQARTPAPADSFPGLMALITGGTPAATGVYYDVSYDRGLSAPGSDCHTLGTVVRYDEALDLAGAPYGAPVLDTHKLPLDPARDCTPVAPHRFLRVNTVFDVVHDAGGTTAWADKHPVYEIVMGPSGQGVDDLYTPEIGDNYRGAGDAAADKVTASVQRTAAYDRDKAKAVLNQIAGRRHDGQQAAPVPTLFGLNLQAVSVGQKRGGYLDASGRPGDALALALMDTDTLIGELVQALRDHQLLDETLVVVTAKHGNGPVDSARLHRVSRALLERTVADAAGANLGQVTSDAVALIWLKASGPAATRQVVDALNRQAGALGIDRVLWGPSLAVALSADRQAGRRRPDIVVVPHPGVIYAGAGDDKRAEHGGFSDDDRDVALLLSNPVWFAAPRHDDTPVGTVQVAPTLLLALGLDPARLQAVRQQHVHPLPGLRGARR